MVTNRPIALLLLAGLVALAPASGAQDLPIDPAVRIGTLDNGLTYYVRENREPAQRAQLRLVIHAGSVLEENDELGLAHFVEHMLFNGTAGFPRQELVDFFERVGMRFGPDVNAYTSFDETVYMLEVPTDSAAILRAGFAVMREWADRATLSDEEIEAERGVILEEWRNGLGASGRVRDRVLPRLLHGSRYAARLPIGDPDIIANSPPEAIKHFYHRWYRPDLAAVIVVGDAAADDMEALVREHFDGWNRSDARADRPVYDVPTAHETLYEIVTDPETPSIVVDLLYKESFHPATTVEAYQARLASRLATGMLNRRLAEIARDGTSSPFLWARLASSSPVRPMITWGLTAQVEDDSLEAGLSTLVTEAQRARQHGFTEEELDRQKAVMLRAQERAALEAANVSSATLAARHVRHFLSGTHIMSAADELGLVRTGLPQVTTHTTKEALARQLTDQGRVVLVTMPEREGVPPPAAEDLERVISRSLARPIEPYVDTGMDQPLLARSPAGGHVVSRSAMDSLGVTQVTLSNGIRVVLKPTDYREDEVLLTAFSPGGTSLAPDSFSFTATVTDLLVVRSGVGEFDQTALTKKLAGQSVRVAPFIGELNEGFSGRSSVQDIETLFKLVYLYATQPRLDEASLISFRNQQRTQLEGRSLTPGAAFADSLFVAMYPDDPRRKLMTVKQIDGIRAEEALAFYRDRFADMDDFTFILVGNLDLEYVIGLAARYLGSLPATDRLESWRDVSAHLPDGIVHKQARKGADPQARAGLVFHGPLKFTPRNRMLLRMVGSVLDLRIREELRESRGGIYSASVQTGTTRLPRGEYTLSIFFGCDPDRLEELVRAVHDEIALLRDDLPLEPYLEKVRAQFIRDRETALEQNGFWLSTLQFYLEDSDESIEEVYAYDHLVRSITPSEVREAARQWLNERYVEVTLVPE